MPLPDIDTVLDWRGRTVVDRDGEKIGKLDDLYLDEETSRPEWAGISTGVFGRRQSLVPLRDAQLVDEDVQVPFEQEQVKDAPKVEPEETLSQEEEASLYRHYGLEYSSSGTVLPEQGQEHEQAREQERDQEQARGLEPERGQETERGLETDQGQRQPQEQSGAGEGASGLGVGTEVRPRERLRLKKYVVTEHVTRKVPVSREEVRLEREPADAEAKTDPSEGGQIGESEDEVVLRQEEPVFEKDNEEKDNEER
jgi:sporulation protein YlmC with PRC-barrel domain